MNDRGNLTRPPRRRQRRAPPPLRRDLPAITVTFTPSRRVLHWRVLARDLGEQEHLMAVVERILGALEVAA